MFFVKIVNNEVVECWDTQPPAGDAGWKSAVEVRPEVNPLRQIYTEHHFDITKDPVEIVWGVRDLTIDERKGVLRNEATNKFAQVVQKELQKEVDEYPETQYDAAVVDAARIEFEASMDVINAAATHEEIDALM